MGRSRLLHLFAKPLPRQQVKALAALAEGIECGAKLLPPATGQTFHLVEGVVIGSCALGAAHHCYLLKRGIPLPTTEDEWIELRQYTEYTQIVGFYGVDGTMATTVPFTPECLPDDSGPLAGESFVSGVDLIGIIWRLNDQWAWSRERIAAWLRTLR